MSERVAEMAIGMHELRKQKGYTADIQRWYCPNCAELIIAYTGPMSIKWTEKRREAK